MAEIGVAIAAGAAAVITPFAVAIYDRYLQRFWPYSKAMRIRRLSPRDPIPHAPAQSEIDTMWANAASAPYAAQPRFVPMNEQQSVISSSPDDSDEKWQAMKRRMPGAASVEQPAASSSSSIEMVPTGPIISTRLQMPGSSSEHAAESPRSRMRELSSANPLSLTAFAPRPLPQPHSSSSPRLPPKGASVVSEYL